MIKDFPLCNDYQEDSEEYKNKYRDIKFQFLLFFEQVVHCFAVNKIKNKNKILRLRSLVNNFIAENFQDANKDNLFNGNSYGERSFWYSFESIPKYSDCLEILSCKLSIENVINTLSTNIAKLYKNENKQPANYDYYINIISEKLKDEDMGALIDIVKKKI